MRYCHQCGSRVPLDEGHWSPCCPPRSSTADPMFATYEGSTVRAMALDEWGADCQAVVRALAQCGGSLPFNAMAKFLGWEKDRVKAVCVARGRPGAAAFGAVFMKIVCGSWWLFLPDRTVDGLPTALRELLEERRSGTEDR